LKKVKAQFMKLIARVQTLFLCGALGSAKNVFRRSMKCSVKMLYCVCWVEEHPEFKHKVLSLFFHFTWSLIMIVFPAVPAYRRCLYASVVLLLFVLCQPLAAQETASGWQSGNRFMIHAGAGLPIGSFGQAYNLAGDFDAALAQLRSGTTMQSAPNERTEIGNATLGFAAGVTDMYKITPNLSVMGTLEVMYNSFNAADYTKQYNALINDPAFIQRVIGSTMTAGTNIDIRFTGDIAIAPRAYLNTALLLGGRYDISLGKGLSVFATAQAGGVYSLYPEDTRDAKLTARTATSILGTAFSVEQATATKSKIDAVSAFAFAYKVGAGVLIADRINVGVSYFGSQPQFSPLTGSASVTATSTTTIGTRTTTLAPMTSTVNQTIVARNNLPIGILQVSIGYVLGE
jgi:hypothetical protein